MDIIDFHSQSILNDKIRYKRRKKVFQIIISILLIILLIFCIFLPLFYFFFLKKFIHDKFISQIDSKYETYLSPDVHGKLTKALIYDKMKVYAIKNNVKIIKGRFRSCADNGCGTKGANEVTDARLKLISELLQGDDPIDLEKEFEILKKYNEFTNKYEITYKGTDDFNRSYTNFRRNSVKIEEHNKNPDRLYNMDYTYFADKEGGNLDLRNYHVNEETELSRISGSARLPNQVIHVDWREKGVVPEVIGQGGCGSCWAVSAADVYSSFQSIKNNKLMTYSYQQVLDCTAKSFGCGGGFHRVALEYMANSKLCLHKNYEYKAEKKKCMENTCEGESRVKGVVSLTDKEALNHLKEKGPFVTSFDVSSDFELYGDGIFNGSCKSREGHSIVVVGHGYDKERKVNYWIVKNSWGKDWGENGYFRILDEEETVDGVKGKFCDFLINAYGLE